MQPTEEMAEKSCILQIITKGLKIWNTNIESPTRC